MNDNRTTERLRALLDERGVEYETHDIIVGKAVTWTGSVCNWVALPDERGLAVGVYKDYLTPEQAVAATLGMKVKSHPYGYEPDTGAFDATRCECGCINDISAAYCNDCGGEIEIDMDAEKEIYHTPAHMVFAEKHDDGSLEFAGKRYIAATLGYKVNGETSDGYHTFNELYHHRAVLFSVIVANLHGIAWKSKLHHDGTMYDGMFIVGIDTPWGQASYHYDVDPYWDMFWCMELERAPEWDGHTPADAIERIGLLRDVVFKGPKGRR